MLFFQHKRRYFEQNKLDYFATPKGRKIVEQNAEEDKKLIDAKFGKLEKKAKKIGARVVMIEDESGEGEETMMLKSLEKNQAEGVVMVEEEKEERQEKDEINKELVAERNDQREVER